MKTQLAVCFCMLLLAFAIPSQAALVTVNLDLAPVNASTNQLTLGLLGESATSDLNGDITAIFDIDFATGLVSRMQLTGGTIMSTDWTIITPAPPGGAGNVSGAAIGATTITPSGLAPFLTATTFDATLHRLVVNSGTVNAPSVGFTQNFATEPLNLDGVGIGSLTSVLNGNSYDFTLTLPIDSIQNIVAGVDLLVTGNLVANGQVAVPEPSSSLFLLAAAGTTFFRRRSRC